MPDEPELDHDRDRPPSRMLRGLAVLAGGGVLLVAIISSLGMAIAAPIGIAIAARRRRRRGERITVFRSWLSAVAATVLLAVVGAGALAWVIPPSALEEMRQAVLKTPPPEPSAFERTMERLNPAAARTSVPPQAFGESPRTFAAFMAMVGAMSAVSMGLFFGSIAWAGSVVLGYGLTGRWPSRPPPPPPGRMLQS